MTDTAKTRAGEAFPALSWQRTDGGRLEPAGMFGWRMVVIYRGAHCPLCKAYLATLETLRKEYQGAGIAVAALSGDPEEKARTEAIEQGGASRSALG